jgi:SAM-dependent methyltransferase
MEIGRTFDGVAALYDAQRTGYPDALFEDLLAIAGLSSGDRMLEIGCGSGQATAGFAARGLDITAIDPGSALVDLARQRFAGSPNVRFAVGSFEEWPFDAQPFRLVAAAQSWHWLRADIRFAKAAGVLVPGGHLAVFGHTPRWPAALIARLEPVYRKYAPAIWGPPPESWYLPEGPIGGLFAASGFFEAAQHRSYAWSRRYSAQSFVAYLSTRSDHHVMSTEQRAAVLAEVEAALPQDVETDWVSNLYVASRAR